VDLQQRGACANAAEHKIIVLPTLIIISLSNIIIIIIIIMMSIIISFSVVSRLEEFSNLLQCGVCSATTFYCCCSSCCCCCWHGKRKFQKISAASATRAATLCFPFSPILQQFLYFEYPINI